MTWSTIALYDAVGKKAADTFTISRALVACFLIWVGLIQRAELLPVARRITLLAWPSDCLEGPLARRGPVPYRSWVGDNDLLFDLAFAVGLLVYMLLTGFLDFWLGGGYILLPGA